MKKTKVEIVPGMFLSFDPVGGEISSQSWNWSASFRFYPLDVWLGGERYINDIVSIEYRCMILILNLIKSKSEIDGCACIINQRVGVIAMNDMIRFFNQQKFTIVK